MPPATTICRSSTPAVCPHRCRAALRRSMSPTRSRIYGSATFAASARSAQAQEAWSSRLPLSHGRRDSLHENRVVQEEEVRREDQRVLLGGFALGGFLDPQDLLPRRLEGVRDAPRLDLRALERQAARVHRELVRAAKERLPHRDSGRGGAAGGTKSFFCSRGDLSEHAPRPDLVRYFRARLAAVERVDQPRVLDDADELARDRLSDWISSCSRSGARESGRRSRRRVDSDRERNAEERLELLFLRLGEIAVARMRRRILDVEGASPSRRSR